jgi:hypothetical protein
MSGYRPLVDGSSRSSGRDDGAGTDGNVGVNVIKPNRLPEGRKGEESVEAKIVK